MLKVLFISRAKNNMTLDNLIKDQAESLNYIGEIEHFLIEKGGFLSYLKKIRELRKKGKSQNFSLIHAHYGLCGFLAILAFPEIPKVVSFMGSDLHRGRPDSIKSFILGIISRCISIPVQVFSQKIIIKSEKMLKYIFLKRKTYIIPNGIILSRFKSGQSDTISSTFQNPLCNSSRQKILFLGNPLDRNKNFRLLAEAFSKSGLENTAEILTPYPVSAEEIPGLLHKGDVLVLTSYKEGSPNVIKEAMVCNCPIVTTDVGDVRWIIGDTEGCFISSFNSVDLANKIRSALDFARATGRTNGLQRILELGLDSESIARRIAKVYYESINDRKAKNSSD
jgi:glycosyltransferase involved in cell wall biosynthesis